MKITIVAMETPYPPIHGGRVDVWRRIIALSNLGVDLQLICWNHTLPSHEETVKVQKYVKQFYPIQYSRGINNYLRRGLNLFKYPLQVTSRIMRGEQWEHLLEQVSLFAPDIILADHIHCGLVAQNLSHRLNKPFVVRSHDIEHLHYKYWLEAAQGLSKLKLVLALWHLKSYEFSVLQSSAAFFDISIDDLQFWEEQGLSNGKFLPPLIDLLAEKDPQDLCPQDDSYDVVFLGNLRTENNVEGVLWFLNEVLPILRRKIPDMRVLIAGSHPVKQICEICAVLDEVTLKANPVSARSTYLSGKVLINPVATGSGTSIKSVDMLTLNRPIVTLEKGLFGLPPTSREYFKVAHDANSFAELVAESLTCDANNIADLAKIESLFGYPVIENFLQELTTLIERN